MSDVLLDALGNKIVIGNRYGFATSKNGITRVVVGTAVNMTKTRVSIKVDMVTSHLYGGEAKIVSSTETISAHACKMFPVS